MAHPMGESDDRGAFGSFLTAIGLNYTAKITSDAGLARPGSLTMPSA